MPGENRTHNSALGGHGYIHLTTDTYSVFIGYSNTHFGELFSPWSPNRSPNFILADCRVAKTHNFEQFLHCFTPFSRVHIRNSTPLGGACYIHLTKEAYFLFISIPAAGIFAFAQSSAIYDCLRELTTSL